MRANWITSTIAGCLFGAAVSAINPKEGMVAGIFGVLFFATVFIGVVGIPQLREMYAERRRRGMGWMGVMAAREDFTKFYLPTWGRMFVWFLSCAGTAAITQSLLR